jgi:hypothetical protein
MPLLAGGVGLHVLPFGRIAVLTSKNSLQRYYIYYNIILLHKQNNSFTEVMHRFSV